MESDITDGESESDSKLQMFDVIQSVFAKDSQVHHNRTLILEKLAMKTVCIEGK